MSLRLARGKQQKVGVTEITVLLIPVPQPSKICFGLLTERYGDKTHVVLNLAC